MCGGTLLNRLYVLTAMHCVSGRWDIQVVMGEHNINMDIHNHTTKSIQVEKVILRHDYDPRDVNNDIALLRLAEDVIFTTTIVPACLPTNTRQLYTGWNSVVSGWGVTQMGGKTSHVLRETTQTILPQTAPECLRGAGGQASTKPVPLTKLCAYRPNTDTCQGDSGGPLVVMEEGRWTVVGVVSYGFGCAWLGYAGIYTRVTEYLHWIQDNIQDGWCSSQWSVSPLLSRPGPWCDLTCTNVKLMTAEHLSLNGITSTCHNGFCAATDGSSLCNTFNYPCGAATKPHITTQTTTLTSTTTTTTTSITTKSPQASPPSLPCSRPCNLASLLPVIKEKHPHLDLSNGLWNLVLGPLWDGSSVALVTDMETGDSCPTDLPQSDLCNRLGLPGTAGK